MSIEYIAIPKKVVALQWFPGAMVPSVTPVFQEIGVDSGNPKRVITHGTIGIKGRVNRWKVDPGDYVIYDPETMDPMDAVGADVFAARYVSRKAYDLCDVCWTKAKEATTSFQPQTIEDIRRVFEDGRGPLPLKTSGGIVFAYTWEHFLKIQGEEKAIKDAVNKDPTPA